MTEVFDQEQLAPENNPENNQAKSMPEKKRHSSKRKDFRAAMGATVVAAGVTGGVFLDKVIRHEQQVAIENTETGILQTLGNRGIQASGLKIVDRDNHFYAYINSPDFKPNCEALAVIDPYSTNPLDQAGTLHLKDTTKTRSIQTDVNAITGAVIGDTSTVNVHYTYLYNGDQFTGFMRKQEAAIGNACVLLPAHPTAVKVAHHA